MPKKKTKEEFIKEATEKHKGKYDYSKVDYVNSKTKVCIICNEPDHGEFWQRPADHIKGNSCPKCSGHYVPTTKEWIVSANEIHNGKYDYHKVEYVDSNTKVCINCPEHGEFWQRPADHIKGNSCPKCSGHYVPTTKEWIALATEKHEGKYDYSKVDYVNDRTKVCIICPNPEHGEFWQRPYHHTRGAGCPKCANEANGERCRSSKEAFIKKARKEHGDKYNYSKVEYVDSDTKVCIICPNPEHGEFWQRPSSHAQGKGCPKCANESTSERCRLSKEDFIKKAREKHGGKYDYTKVNYVNNKTKVCIICPEHGEFKQNPKHHKRGVGCPKCYADKVRERLTLTKEEFIEKACEKHGNKYDYSKVEYVDSNTKVCIICPNPEHGEFCQKPSKHLQGQGCPKCNLSHLERSVMNYLDNMGITYDYQKHFKWLGQQSLDFYLPDYKVGVECQGLQHFFPVEYFGGDKGFKQTLERDKRKKALCEKHDIKLLYFGNVPNCDTFLGEKVHDDVQYIIEYLNEYEKKKNDCQIDL